MLVSGRVSGSICPAKQNRVIKPEATENIQKQQYATTTLSPICSTRKNQHLIVPHGTVT